ncbi:hypothetical protein K1719_016176 [Acacia pycnantha]|nr:hypothetical protein K1719_016176 [Acacia pycnantha]
MSGNASFSSQKKGWGYPYIYLYQGIWYTPTRIQAICSFQKHFQAKDSDIVIATLPKSGTTWLKALTFAILNRKHFPPSQNNHPLLFSNAHDLVPFFEYTHYANNQIPDLSNMPEPRLLALMFHFIHCLIQLPNPHARSSFERYSNGINEFGPFWTHMLGYWRESKETPNKILFMKYEDLKGDMKFSLKRVAEFLGCPFNLEEESNGVIEKIIELCSFEKMKEQEVNKTGKFAQKYENKHLFRKAKVGDWINHFPPGMEAKLSKVIEEKLGGSGLYF